MLDYIGGDIVRMTPARSGHQGTLQLQYCDDDGEPLYQQFHVRGPQPGQLGERLVVMVLEDEVAGWHNQLTGAQGHLLHRLPSVRWRLRDVLIALASGLSLGWIANLPLGVAVGLGWILSTPLARLFAAQCARRTERRASSCSWRASEKMSALSASIETEVASGLPA